MKTIIALDLGTTGNRAIAFSKDGQAVAKSYYEFEQLFPKPGWVEHDPAAIWDTTLRALKDVVKKVGAGNIGAIGITNQRETTILWDKHTGKPIYNAIVWQCRRTKGMCEKLSGYGNAVRNKTGLFIDPYFSATKIRWILDNVKGARERAKNGDIIFGTVDTWILWNLTGGKVHATEPSNASRTMLYNIYKNCFDSELLGIFGIPEKILPEVRESGSLFGETDRKITGISVPVTGILGDQQAALFAQAGWEKGVIKNTYGTGLFLMTAAEKSIDKSNKLVHTIAWMLDGKVSYALEGSVFVGGSCIQWLRDGLKIIAASPETEPMAKSLRSNDGVYFVPALAGLGAPYWDPDARGIIIGITRGTRREHIARAALEGIAYQVRDVFEAMEKAVHAKFKKLRVDGGASKNDFLMQFQADLLNTKVERPVSIETTAFGAAGIAGIKSGFWTKKGFLKARKIDRVFKPSMHKNRRDGLYGMWKEAVKRSMRWAK